MNSSRHNPDRAAKGPVFNLRTKVMIIFLVLALVPLMIIGWFSIQTTEKLILSMVMRQIENAATDKAAILERWLDERKADMEVVAGSSIIKSMEPERISPYLELMREKYGVYKDLTVVSDSGQIVYNSNKSPSASLPDIHRKPGDQKDGLRISAITYAPEEKESSFFISAPITSGREKFTGAVYGRVGTSKIINLILNISLGETGECYLVNEEGRFLAHQDPHRILTENISQSESFKNIFEQRDTNKAYLDYRGIEVLGTSRNVGGTDWYIVVEQDRDEAFESASTLKSIIFLTVLLCIGSALMLTWMLSYNIVNPIRRLSRYAEMIADSNFDKEIVKTARNDEIGMLYRAFEDMYSKLARRHNHLKQEVGLKEAELKETDMILEKTRRVAERSEKFAAMGRMGAAVAHEIRTPLTSLKLYLESAQEQISKRPEDEEDFRVAMKQINRIETSINRFLDFVKPQDLVFSVIDIGTLIEDVLYMIRPLANRQECTLDSEIEPGLPHVSGDRKLLAEALVNLMVNSLEAVGEHGRVSVTAAQDRFDKNGVQVACVKIEIRDTGQGIAEDQMENLFEPFYTTKASGTGLGLPLVLNTVKNHGGTIRVKSEVYKGTAFCLFIPFESGDHPREDHGKDTYH
ncbi:MAG: cache domain-containing protein [Desulfosalsimonas sp.]